MTNSAMNDNVMYGARSCEPQALTSLSSLPIGVADVLACARGHQSRDRQRQYSAICWAASRRQAAAGFHHG